MKITKLSTYRLAPRWMFLKIETDEGVSGWGEPVIEGRARTVQAAVDELSEYVIGKDPSRINDIWQTLYRGGFYRGGPILMSAPVCGAACRRNPGGHAQAGQQEDASGLPLGLCAGGL